MASQPRTPGRADKLLKRFNDVKNGKAKISTPADAQLFLEAVRSQQSPSLCIEIIFSNPSGLDAVRSCVRADLTLAFIQSNTLKFINYISDPDIKTLADGQFLQQLLLVIAQPPTFWNALVNFFLKHSLPEEALQPFAWLALELFLLPSKLGLDILKDVQAILEDGSLTQATSHSTRELGYKIQKAIQIKSCPSPVDPANSPGGRHDNDFPDFRKIAIYPTTDEFLATAKPFYRSVGEVFEAELVGRAGIHLDNQFRLFREDMLAELRNDLQIASGRKKGRFSALQLGQFWPSSIETEDKYHRSKKCALAVHCSSGLEILQRKDMLSRRKFLDDNKHFLKHQGFGALCDSNNIYGFAFIDRNIDLLLKNPPIVLLQFTDSEALGKALFTLRSVESVQFILVGTPVFAYEPVLNGLKDMMDLPLHETLLDPKSTNVSYYPVDEMQPFISKLRSVVKDKTISVLSNGAEMDQSQMDSLLSAFINPVSIIQGPPGTGKSLIGSQIIKWVHKVSNQKVLVISYTNHALDQFLEELLDVNIPDDEMVRLGSKSTFRTCPLLLSNQKGEYKRSKHSWGIIGSLRADREMFVEELEQAMTEYRDFSISFDKLLEYLEFSSEYQHFYNAFSIPSENSEWKHVGRKGKEIAPDYLFGRWISGDGPGVFTNRALQTSLSVWEIHPTNRKELLARWTKIMVQERAEAVQAITQKLDDLQERLEDLYNEDKSRILQEKRIIGCTTTAAAMYNKMIRAAKPDIVLVEEAGEILESHILTALAPTVKQLILIGDHKQLRPKVNNYALTVEKGDGYDLNRSLFERLILQGHAHTTLRKQHRMHPEISMIPRALTYPDLLDGPKTLERQTIDGLLDRVIFVHHDHPEVGVDELIDRRDPTTKASKQNEFEAWMVLKCVKYLGQQGYNTDKMVVLTPYLGQLRFLRDILREENDPELSDLDAFDLIRAGLMTSAAAKVEKRPLRLSTIDNYQGEESDIIIASLTRSNSDGDIGFMAAPERLNVLVSRARCCIIMIGNMDTFMNSKRGKDTWMPFFRILKERQHLYDGLPVKCERHPERTALLKGPNDFDKYCPDGGCAEICGVMMKCGQHKCPLRCHRVSNHSQKVCTASITRTCERQHRVSITCDKKNDRCDQCLQEDKEQERRVKRDLNLEAQRLARQAAYLKELQEIQDEIEHERRSIKYITEEQEQKNTLAQKRADIKELRETAMRIRQKKDKENAAASTKADDHTVTDLAGREDPSTTGLDLPETAKEEWDFLKRTEGAKSAPLDELIGMIGLEDVKQEFLSIKHRVDTTLRQDVSLASDRFSCTLLGNPGTGKTTVARLYARFLTSVGVIPGVCFKETTGSALANLGVSGCTKLIDEILNDGGGVLFIDEAYQLSSGNSPGGKAVLDYLLPEVENLTGKVVFVLAGYNKQMESFFAHNPGLPSRFPVEMKFADYTYDELLRILELKIRKRYGKNMKCEDGLKGLYCRIVARRISRGRGRDGFGNARTVENTLAQISRRQAIRLPKERRAGQKPNDLFFTKEDLIGPEPLGVLSKSEGWRKIQELIGLNAVKESVKSLVDTIQQNYLRELAEEPPIEYSLNKVFLGSPGTGKTTVAKLYGKILVELGFLSKGEVVMKNPSDFVGAALGQSEQQTKGILDAALGKVLVIDEAYGLYGGGGNQGSTADPYKTAVIDTIVAEVQSVPGDDRCVLLLGYKDQMETMFQNVNPGLSRRFPISSAFVFEDFDDFDLKRILDLKLKQQGFSATDQAKNVAMEILSRARNRPHFGNAGEVDIVLDASKARHQRRLTRGEVKAATILEALDFDEDFDRAERNETNVKKLFEGTVGCDEIVDRLEGYQETVRMMKALQIEDEKENIPFNFLFRGPPGTGKTTTAKKMGKVFYDMGFLSKAEVVECSATDLIGQFVGQTGPKVQQLLDKALGKVLFIDEAYRLASGHFAQEAIDELVDSTTKPRYFKKLVIILAGYEEDIGRLMSVNPGLTSRFAEVIDFRGLKPHECVGLLQQQFRVQKAMIKKKNNDSIVLDIASLQSPTLIFQEKMKALFSDLSQQANWASARDVQTLAKNIFNKTIKSPRATGQKLLKVSEVTIMSELTAMLHERISRSKSQETVTVHNPLTRVPLPFDHPRQQITPITTTSTTMAQGGTQAEPEDSPPEQSIQSSTEANTTQRHPEPSANTDAQRDAGVSDEVWEQLQQDRKAEQEREAEYQELIKAKEKASEEAREKIVKRLVEEERRRKAEAEMRQKLATMGACPVGYAWIKQAHGYRCAGGSHYMSEDQLGSL